MAKKGTVKYPGYKTGGIPKKSGLRNNRSKARRKAAEAERKRLREFESTSRKERYSNPYDNWEED